MYIYVETSQDGVRMIHIKRRGKKEQKRIWEFRKEVLDLHYKH